MRALIKRVFCLLTGIVLAAGGVSAGEVEVLHWWTSGGEARSVAVLKDLLKKEGHTWKDMAIAGGGGGNALTVLRTRIIAGNPPAAAQIKGPEIQRWGEEGVLANLNSVAIKAGWDAKMPKMISNIHKYKGQWVAVPANIHRLNWMWINPKVFEKAKAKIPSTWPQFFEAMDKIKAAGMIPIAFGGQSWQELAVFDIMALSIGGPEFYKKAFVSKDQSALSSQTMVEVFKAFKKLKKYVDKDHPGRDWNLATSMVIKGEAGVQFMGDWAKGEFTAAGKTPGIDYICKQVPGTARSFIFLIDTFMMFQLENKDDIEAQKALARIILEPEFQTTFNVNKGSIPIIRDIDRSAFDACANLSMDDFADSSALGRLVPSIAFDMAAYPDVTGAIRDVVTKFWNSRQTAEVATSALAKAVRSLNL